MREQWQIASKFKQSTGLTLRELAGGVSMLAGTSAGRWERSKVSTHAFGRDGENLDIAEHTSGILRVAEPVPSVMSERRVG